MEQLCIDAFVNYVKRTALNHTTFSVENQKQYTVPHTNSALRLSTDTPNTQLNYNLRPPMNSAASERNNHILFQIV